MNDDALTAALTKAHNNIVILARAAQMMLNRIAALEERVAKDEAADAMRKASAP